MGEKKNKRSRKVKLVWRTLVVQHGSEQEEALIAENWEPFGAMSIQQLVKDASPLTLNGPGAAQPKIQVSFAIAYKKKLPVVEEVQDDPDLDD